MRTYLKLRGIMAENGINQTRLGLELGFGRSCLTQRFSNRTSWSLTEMYKIMDYFNIDYSRLHEIFPKDGIAR